MKSFILSLIFRITLIAAFVPAPCVAAEYAAAKLAPAEAMLAVEIHDVPRTLARWKEISWSQIAKEPEWKAFTAKLGGFVDESPQWGIINGVLAEVKKVDPISAFLIVGEVKDFNGDEVPPMVAGFSYGGGQAEVRAILKSLREKAADVVKFDSESSTEDGVEIEKLMGNDFSMTAAYVDKWFFIATDKKLLLETVARHSGKAPPGMAATEAWKNGQQQALADPDMTFFMRYDLLMKGLGEAGDAEAAMFKALADWIPESWTTTLKLDGLAMRERTYMHYKNPLPRGKGVERSLAFTGANTYAFIGADYGGWEDAFKKMIAALPVPEKIPELEKHGLTLADMVATFGPELAILSDWEPGALAMPSAFAAVELRDAAKGRKFAEMIVAEMKDAGEVTERDVDGTHLWTWSVGIPVVKPTLAVNDKHLMFGLNPDSILDPLTRAKDGAASLAKSPVFVDAVKSVAEPNGGLMFLNSKLLFERLYDRGRPFIAFQLAGDSPAAKYLDGAALPATATLSRHLPPMVISFHSAGNGYLMESAGPVTYITGILGTSMVAAIAMPALSRFMQRAREAEEK